MSKGALLHSDLKIIRSANNIAALASDRIAVPYSIILDNTAKPAAQYPPAADLAVFHQLSLTFAAFNNIHNYLHFRARI